MMPLGGAQVTISQRDVWGSRSHRVDDAPLHDGARRDLETQPDEEGRRRLEICDSDADVVETLHA